MHFFLTTGPRSGYSAIGGAGLSSYCLSLIVETMSIECKRNRHYKTIKRSQKKKKKKKKKRASTYAGVSGITGSSRLGTCHGLRSQVLRFAFSTHHVLYFQRVKCHIAFAHASAAPGNSTTADTTTRSPFLAYPGPYDSGTVLVDVVSAEDWIVRSDLPASFLMKLLTADRLIHPAKPRNTFPRLAVTGIPGPLSSLR